MSFPNNLHANEELYSIFLNGVNDGLFDWDLTNDSIFYASSYETILGYTAEELGASHDAWRAILHPDDRAAGIEMTRRYANREIPAYYNVFRVRHKDGRWIWIQSRAVGVWDKNGKMIRLVGVHTDITLQKQHEEELRLFAEENKRQREELEIAKERAETANRAKSDFLATMSHEIRTPLNVVVGISRLLVDRMKTPKEREMVQVLNVNADLLSKLVSDLLDLNRIETTGLELEALPFAPGDILQTLRQMFDGEAAKKKITFTIVNQTGPCVFVGDAVRLQQILVNLVANALKFTPCGSITVTAASRLVGGKVKLCVTVADTGVGIPPGKLATIFEKFVQGDQTISRRFGGSGLGLAISKSLVERMGGDIAVTSTLNEGSVFTVNLPFEMGVAGSDKPDEDFAVAVVPQGRGTALLVEDYPANALVATLLLERLGYAVEEAPSGFSALAKVQARSKPYDVILMDVQMSDMDGFETTQRLRSLEKLKGFRQYIIGITAHAMPGDYESCIKSGMDNYLTKPINPSILAQKLNETTKAA